jgi:16S rRNA (guanine527-N7)-methyltransferase
MDRELILSAADKLQLQINPVQLDKLEFLQQELLRWNKSINLTAITEPGQITIKHLIDSLQLVPLSHDSENLLDVGSGAGFPGLVLAILRQDCNISSIDSVGKKISFQKHILRSLKLSNFTAINGRAEELVKKQSSAFSLVVSRAFSSLEKFAALALPLLAADGRIISMRSNTGEDELNQLKLKLASMGLQPEQPVKYQLPGQSGDRTLVILRKAV